MQGREPFGPRLAGLGDPEVVEHVIQELVERQRRVDDEGDGRDAVQSRPQRSEQRRLAGSRLAREDDDPLALVDAADELAEHQAMPGGEVEERRIRRGVERLRLEAVEVEVHGGVPVLVSIPQIVTRVDAAQYARSGSCRGRAARRRGDDPAHSLHERRLGVVAAPSPCPLSRRRQGDTASAPPSAGGTTQLGDGLSGRDRSSPTSLIL